MASFPVAKRPTEKYDIDVVFVNEDPSIIYVVQSVNNIIAINRNTGVDQTSIVVDNTLTAFHDNVAVVWLQGGTNGSIYDITVEVTMAGGQIFDKQIELSVRNKI